MKRSIFAAVVAPVLMFLAAGAALAQPPEKAKPEAAERPPFDLSYVPGDAMFVLAVRPAELLNKPAVQEALASQNRKLPEEFWNLPLEQIEQAVFAYRPVQHSPVGLARELTRVTVRLRTPHRAEAILDRLDGREKPFVGGKYFVIPEPPHPLMRYAAATEERTLVFARDEGAIRHAVFLGPVNVEQFPWGADFQQGAGAADVAFVGTLPPLVRRELLEAPRHSGRHSTFAELMPLWRSFRYVVGAAVLDDQLSVRLISRGEDRDATDAARAALTLARDQVFRLEEESLTPRDLRNPGLGLLRLANRLLSSADIAPYSGGVIIEMSTPANEETLQTVASLTHGAEQLSVRTASAKKLKQLAFAMHNYHDTFRRLPPPVVMGPDGENPHSWRVAILPFLGGEAQKLHDRYNFQEPWDSPHNEKLIAEMPDVFRHPLAAADSTHASYYALTGPHTPFREQGTWLADIVDGTANTILLVEAKREIPWTKPEDIPVKPGEPPPQFGGFFAGGYNVVGVDGSAHFLPYNFDREMLERLIARADGKPVDWRGDAGR